MGERWGRQGQRSFDGAVQCEDQFVRLADDSDEQMIGGDDGESPRNQNRAFIGKQMFLAVSPFFFNPYDFLLEYVFLLLQPEEQMLSSLVEIVNNFFFNLRMFTSPGEWSIIKVPTKMPAY